MKIQPIVEGHGEVKAVPELLRRLQQEASCYNISFGSPIRRPASDLNNKTSFQNSVRLALLHDDCAAILILFDLDDGCPKEKAAELVAWTDEIATDVPFAIVLAHREYEAWFLAAVESLRGYNGIPADAVSPLEPENIRGAKQHLERLMARFYSYSETSDQVRLTARFDMAAAYRRSRSFRRLVNAFGQLLAAFDEAPEQWPPANWVD